MAVCGYCKHVVELHGIRKAKNRTENTVILETVLSGASMVSCPHCNTVLGFL